MADAMARHATTATRTSIATSEAQVAAEIEAAAEAAAAAERADLEEAIRLSAYSQARSATQATRPAPAPDGNLAVQSEDERLFEMAIAASLSQN